MRQKTQPAQYETGRGTSTLLSGPLAFALDAETAHRATIAVLKLAAEAPAADHFQRRCGPQVAGLEFASPVGLAAGFDKNAEVPEHMLGLGFGFVEVGTVTPRPQAGNPKPRLFRLAEDRAVINRMGFNNGGQPAALARLRGVRTRAASSASTSAPTRTARTASRIMPSGVRAMARVARISDDQHQLAQHSGFARSCRTKGRWGAARGGKGSTRPSGPPIFLKVAPDLGEGEHDQIVRAAIEHGVDALIVANTTVSRPVLKSRYAERDRADCRALR